MKTSTAECHLHSSQRRWFAVYTKFQREKFVIGLLQRKGIEAYAPLRTHVRTYSRKKREVRLPLISGYVFVRITRRDYVAVLETQGVVQFVQFARNLISIPEREIEWLKRVADEAGELDAEPAQMHVGETVEIARGSLAGIRGKLLQRRKRNFVIELEHIGFSLLMQVHPKDLQPVAMAV